MKNIKYIGIRGHRGSGKNTVAYLLGNILQFVIDTYDNYIPTVEELLCNDSFNIAYHVWCDCIKTDESSSIEDMSTPNIYLESFGDTPRVLLQLITNIPNNYFNSDYYKDHVIVNLKDFSWKVYDDPKYKASFDSQLLMSEIDRENIIELDEDEEDITITLRDFIIYFAQVCMKYLGRSVWVKSMRCSETNDYENYYNIGQQFKIFRDIKASSELTFIKDHNGVIIKVDRPKFKKADKGVEGLEDDPRFDYGITINEDISTDQTLKKELINIALQLMS